MLSEWAVFRSNQRTSLHHNAKMSMIIILMSCITMLSSMCVVDRKIKQIMLFIPSLTCVVLSKQVTHIIVSNTSVLYK